MSKADTYKRIAVCPFFRAAYDRTIYCEPVVEEAEQMRISFKTYRACKDHIKHQCASLEGCKTCAFYHPACIPHKNGPVRRPGTGCRSSG